VPELPEVETIRRSLLSLKPSPIKTLHFNRRDIIREQDFAPELLEGETWRDIKRRGKFLSFIFAKTRIMTVHLGMSGRFYSSPALPEEKHIHLVLTREDGGLLVFQDPRRFGGLWFTEGDNRAVARLGAEPLEAEFTEEYLVKILSRRQTSIKNTLLNQNLLAGLGNIYVDEALFAAGISPRRTGASLTLEEIARLHAAIIQVLTAGIEARGTTFRDYRDGLNQRGGYQHQLKVYGRGGQACLDCGTAIESLRIGGRGTHYCPNCQR
jgi:formamidopyrimidine-DNA glycosylase